MAHYSSYQDLDIYNWISISWCAKFQLMFGIWSLAHF